MEVFWRRRIVRRVETISVILLWLLAMNSPIWAAGSHEANALDLSGEIQGVHDPSMIEAAGRYFAFSTGNGIPMRCSENLIHWTECGRVFEVMPLWAVEDIPQADGIWAPDISFFHGLYHLYFAVSTFGSNRSDIGLATTPELRSDGSTRWTDRGRVIESAESDDYNAIDPNVIVAGDGQPWLAFGSFWSGIQIVKLDPATGKPFSDHPRPLNIARRPYAPDAIEAPFIIHRGVYYYLFASFDFCCRGSNSTYNIRVGRARMVVGPYVDRKGVPMLDGGGTRVAVSHDRWRGPGGESVMRDSSGRWWLVYHSYDADLAGIPTLRISPIVFDSDGWPQPVTPISSHSGERR